MSSILKELFYGNIQPIGKRYAPDSPFVEAAQFRQINQEKLLTKLDEEGKEIFEKYCDAQDEIEVITRYDTFSYALKFGMLLMTEVLSGKEEITGEETSQ